MWPGQNILQLLWAFLCLSNWYRYVWKGENIVKTTNILSVYDVLYVSRYK